MLSSLYYSQIAFETGYYINNNGEKVNGLIKNYDWKNNPSTIEFKLNNDSDIQKINQTNFKEFSVGNLEFVRVTSLIDKSSGKTNNLSDKKDFTQIEETIILKPLVEGEINLYKYSENGISIFFYKKNDSDLFHQLKYKEYLEQGRYIKKNEEYKKQLSKELLGSQKVSINEIDQLYYKEANLVKIFSIYNGSESLHMSKNEETKKFHIYIKPGIGFSKYLIAPPNDNNGINNRENHSVMYRIATELEYVLNFNKGKWAIFSEPSFQTVSHSIKDYNRRDFSIDYSSIQIPLGIKHNMFINKNSKIYVSGAMYCEIPVKVELSNDISQTKFGSGIYPTFAAGYVFKKFGAEVKYGVTPYFDNSYYGRVPSLSMARFSASINYQLF